MMEHMQQLQPDQVLRISEAAYAAGLLQGFDAYYVMESMGDPSFVDEDGEEWDLMACHDIDEECDDPEPWQWSPEANAWEDTSRC